MASGDFKQRNGIIDKYLRYVFSRIEIVCLPVRDVHDSVSKGSIMPGCKVEDSIIRIEFDPGIGEEDDSVVPS